MSSGEVLSNRLVLMTPSFYKMMDIRTLSGSNRALPHLAEFLPMCETVCDFFSICVDRTRYVPPIIAILEHVFHAIERTHKQGQPCCRCFVANH